MSITVEFHPDLCLRNQDAFRRGELQYRECIPQHLYPLEVYIFMKEGRRLFWLDGEIALRETKGDGQLSRPLASIVIFEYLHRLDPQGKPWTMGKYQVKAIFDPNDPTRHFDWLDRVKRD